MRENTVQQNLLNTVNLGQGAITHHSHVRTPEDDEGVDTQNTIVLNSGLRVPSEGFERIVDYQTSNLPSLKLIDLQQVSPILAEALFMADAQSAKPNGIADANEVHTLQQLNPRLTIVSQFLKIVQQVLALHQPESPPKKPATLFQKIITTTSNIVTSAATLLATTVGFNSLMAAGVGGKLSLLVAIIGYIAFIEAPIASHNKKHPSKKVQSPILTTARSLIDPFIRLSQEPSTNPVDSNNTLNTIATPPPKKSFWRSMNPFFG